MFILLLLIHSSLSLDFRLRDRILEVASTSSSGNYLPLCVHSYKPEYGESACEGEGGGWLVSSWTPTPSASPTLSIACTTLNCFAFPSKYCKQTISIECGSYCVAGDIQLRDVCAAIGTAQATGFSDVDEACSERVLSLPHTDDVQKLAKFLDPDRMYMTSAVREGSAWRWPDGTAVEREVVSGDGRCLAIRNGTFAAIDCNSAVYALCERPLECVRAHDYQGYTNTSSDGTPCINWDTNPPSNTIPIQRFSHNFCRSAPGFSNPVCLVGPNAVKTCALPQCPLRALDQKLLESEPACDEGLFHCSSSDECIPAEYVCDYERDCSHAEDEKDCPDYLDPFEYVGQFQLVDKVMEIWTNIRNEQSCARQCIESDLFCEGFTYDTTTMLCRLTDSRETGILTTRDTSRFYTRMFSLKDIAYRVNGTVLEANKAAVWAPVCDDLSDTVADGVCRIFGMGLSFRPSSGPALSTSAFWTVDCLRREDCQTTARLECKELRCSRCTSAVCSDGSCIDRAQLCDGLEDCQDGSDEQKCNAVLFRLTGGSTSNEGLLEISLRGQWQSVCESSVTLSDVTAVCRELFYSGGVLYPSNGPPTTTRLLSCKAGKCSAAGEQWCTPAYLGCGQGEAPFTCGERRINAPTRNTTRFTRVVGGYTAERGSLPWNAAIRFRVSGAHHCGASLITHRFLLTAAHCFDEDRRPSTYEVVVGDFDKTVAEGSEQVLPIYRFHFYPLYELLFTHDLVLVEVAAPGFAFSDYVIPICLPSRNFQYTPGKSCVVSGWGSTVSGDIVYPNQLEAAEMPIIERSQCRNLSNEYEFMSSSSFCAGFLAGGVDACQGDSGGPFACQNERGIFVLAGVISWGDGCAQASQPGIYTMVAPYLSWVENIVDTI